MITDPAFAVLREHIALMIKARNWLQRSWDKAKHVNFNEPLSEEDHEKLEVLTSRFARLVDIVQKRVFRSMDAYEFLDTGTMIDVLNRAEKRGLISGREEARELRELRNLIAHEYAEDNALGLYEAVMKKVPLILKICQKIEHWMEEIKN